MLLVKMVNLSGKFQTDRHINRLNFCGFYLLTIFVMLLCSNYLLLLSITTNNEQFKRKPRYL